jgi:hypothetical protein
VATAELVLSRFPRHLDLDGPGKLMGDVVHGLATAAEAQIVQVGKVRQARRLGELDQVADFARIVALHGFNASILDGLARRVRATDPLVSYDASLDVARTMAADLFVLQREENGTVAGLLGAGAAYLGLVMHELDHDAGGYWHLARCRDRLVPGPPDEPTEWLLALEENPPRLADLGPSPFAHGARFSVMRQGFDPVPATVVVKGLQDRTMRPMVVNIDDGFGVVATFAVGDGATLRFERDGRVELDGTSVVRTCFTFRGAVFADVSTDHPKDFVFDDEGTPPDPAAPRADGDRRGVFAVTQPPDDAFDPSPSLPHSDPLLPAVQLDRRETRFAVFVGAGTYAADLGPDGILEPAPHTVAGFFDDTVFLPDPPPAGAPSFEIGFEWDEREAYAVRLWLPLEFQDLDQDGEVPVREVVRGLLDRHRSAGVHVYVEYADPRWTLGTGVLRDLDTDSALGVVVAGTETWEESTEQPGGGP